MAGRPRRTPASTGKRANINIGAFMGGGGMESAIPTEGFAAANEFQQLGYQGPPTVQQEAALAQGPFTSVKPGYWESVGNRLSGNPGGTSEAQRLNNQLYLDKIRGTNDAAQALTRIGPEADARAAAFLRNNPAAVEQNNALELKAIGPRADAIAEAQARNYQKLQDPINKNALAQIGPTADANRTAIAKGRVSFYLQKAGGDSNKALLMAMDDIAAQESTATQAATAASRVAQTRDDTALTHVADVTNREMTDRKDPDAAKARSIASDAQALNQADEAAYVANMRRLINLNLPQGSSPEDSQKLIARFDEESRRQRAGEIDIKNRATASSARKTNALNLGGAPFDQQLGHANAVANLEQARYAPLFLKEQHIQEQEASRKSRETEFDHLLQLGNKAFVPANRQAQFKTMIPNTITYNNRGASDATTALLMKQDPALAAELGLGTGIDISSQGSEVFYDEDGLPIKKKKNATGFRDNNTFSSPY